MIFILVKYCHVTIILLTCHPYIPFHFMEMIFLLVGLCPVLSDPANGMVTMTGNSVGDTATYTCDDGYELIGSMTVTCMDDGAWSDGPPMCRRKQHYIL